MGDLAFLADVGERVAALLRARRDLLAAAGSLAPLPQPFDIHVLAASQLAAASSGLAVTCVQMQTSPDWREVEPIHASQIPVRSVHLDMQFLLSAHADDAAAEQAMIAWAMLEFVRQPVLSGSPNPEVIQLVRATDPTAVFAVWRALGLDYRLSFMMVARNVVLSDPPAPGAPSPVVARRSLGKLG